MKNRTHNPTPVLITCLAFATITAYAFATGRVVLVENPAHYELAEVDCNGASDPINCLMERPQLAGR